MARWLLILCLTFIVALVSLALEVKASDVYYKKVWNAKYYRWEYVKVLVEKHVPNVYHYEYNLDYSQPAAAIGNTVYAAPVLDLYAYSDGDLGAIIDARSRQLSDASLGLDRVTAAIQSRDTSIAVQNRHVANTAFTQALSVLVDKINKNEVQISVGTRDETFAAQLGQGTPTGSSGLLQGPLVLQYCASCHGPQGTKVDTFDLATGLREDALTQVLTGKMPKGVNLTEAARLALAREIAAGPDIPLPTPERPSDTLNPR